MSANRAELLTRKNDLVEALRLLEADHEEGTIDDDAYLSARHRYEVEAAAALQQLEEGEHPPRPPIARSEEPAASREQRTGNRQRRVLAGLGVLAALVVIGVLLVEALRPRVAGGTVTGNGAPATAVAQVSPQLQAAEQRVRLHPRSLQALLDLATQYMNAGQMAAADRTLRRAISLAPDRPEAATMHAFLLASAFNQTPRALALLRSIERAHPRYARVWLIDGLLAGRQRALISRAIADYTHFLALEPRAAVAPEVRKLLAQLKRVQRG